MSRSRGSRNARRFQNRHVANQAVSSGLRGHRHCIMLAPEPWGQIDLPVTFSVGGYERQHEWFTERTGIHTSIGGPLIGWCRCRAIDGRPYRWRGARPYWQIEIGQAEADRMRAAAEAEFTEWQKSHDRHLLFHGNDIMAILNCRDDHTTEAAAERKLVAPVTPAVSAEGNTETDDADWEELFANVTSRPVALAVRSDDSPVEVTADVYRPSRRLGVKTTPTT